MAVDRDENQPGFMLCGTTIVFDASGLEDYAAELVGLSGFGATKKSVEAPSGNAPELWGERLFSCLKFLKPFTMTIAHSGAKDFKALMEAKKIGATLTWPLEEGYTTAGNLVFHGEATDVSMAGQLEDRVLQDVQFTPSGTFVIDLPDEPAP